MRHLTDKEILNHARMTADPLVTSELERELMGRLDKALDREEELKETLHEIKNQAYEITGMVEGE